MDLKRRSIRVLMLPWLAHGHISPFLELAKKLTNRNFLIYFCSTPINLNSIKPKLSSKYSFSIQLVELHLPSLPELPPHYHTTNGLPLHLMNTLKTAFDMASPSFLNILKTLKPDLLICDHLQPWAPSLASSLNIPAIIFPTNSAIMMAFSLHHAKNPGEEFPFPSININDDMVKSINFLHSASNGLTDMDRVLQCLERSSNTMLLKTFRQLEAKYVDYSSALLKKKIVLAGPLVQVPDNEDEKIEIIKWLDSRGQSSTVFVSFGSEYFLSKEEREDIAHGLELSKVNFIWVVRFPVGEKVKLEEALPNGFAERIGERGLVVEGWAPQAMILSHSSIGGFVSHCGWSSMMESMKFGVPIIAMPMHIDQPLNARLVEDVGVGLEIKRNKDGRFEREELARVIKEVLVYKNGDAVRSKAREMSEHIKKNGDQEIDGVADALVKLCEMKTNSLNQD
ncbi:UDPGT domain-containing protein [Cephalotus follicularis]|uniref:Glycosyltransferase n=1 Tax=Cephalotus follicularis TaxID=3775 RepID=A0A1Q3CU17_CEPFO|nr:UDPGT domain-containing protein [Cephalotus follicularis]